MLLMPAQLDRYEEISALSARMVEAARRGDWDGLVDLERHVATLRDGLVAEAAPVQTDSPEAIPEAARVRVLIQQILDDDAEVRRHTEPWMEQVRLLLSGHLNSWQVSAGDNAASGNKRGAGP
jgi:flagellar protein FliT